jgi:hypothetical protein
MSCPVCAEHPSGWVRHDGYYGRHKEFIRWTSCSRQRHDLLTATQQTQRRRTRLSPLRHSLRSRLRNDSRVNPSGLECPYAGRDHTLLRGPVESKQYTSFDYGQELNDARVLASMGSVGDAYDNPSKPGSTELRRV